LRGLGIGFEGSRRRRWCRRDRSRIWVVVSQERQDWKDVDVLVNWSDVVLIERAVVDVDTLSIVDLDSVCTFVGNIDDVGAVVRAGLAESVRKLATGVGHSVQDLSEGVSGLFTRYIGPDDTSDVGVCAPVSNQHGANAVHNHNSVVAD